MDPLSITASAIAVIQICGAAGKAFNDLRNICKTLPGRLQALNDEVLDLAAVLQDVAALQSERAGLNTAPGDQDKGHIAALLGHATSKLTELQQLLTDLTTATKSAPIRLVQANAWRRVQGRLQALQDEIKGVKASLNIWLGASNSRDMVTVRLQTETILHASTNITQQHRDLHDELRQGLAIQHVGLDSSIAQFQDHIDSRLKRIEESLSNQESRLYDSQAKQLGPEMSRIAKQRARAARDPQRKGVSVRGAQSDAIGIRMTQQVGFCRKNCACSCHKQKKTATPTAVDRWLGQLSLEFAGIPMINVRCSSRSCERSQSPQVSLEYWFPLGFLWSQIVRLRMGYERSIGPQLHLSLLRRVPDSAACVDFAMKGNIEGLQDLFRRGLASPRDVSSTRGYTMLRWAMYAKQYQTCKFLLYAGADPDYRPLSPYDNSPRNKANDFIFQGGLSREAEEIYRQIAAGADYVDEQNYTMLHKAVLGLSFRSLEDVIAESPDDIETMDAMGRTPLSWAACRGDEAAIVLLLAHGADPNTVDAQLAGPVSNAADRGHTKCVRLLLEGGGDPDPVRPGVKKGSPLNCASRNAADPLLIKTLLDFGADIDDCGVDGITPLIHVARKDNVSFAQILLEYGANLNAMSSAQQTPLTISITHNSHEVLRLLLDRWYEYSACPRLNGPHMLPLVATFADATTIDILASADHLRLSYDPAFKVGDYLNTLHLRHDVNEELVAAFERLLDVIDYQEQSETPTESAFVSASVSRRASMLFTEAQAVAGAEKDAEFSELERFEDALESLV
ncbi:hypothetical protein LTR85_005124 [Meristemomyces frigidus]|nr:hypothetical protein LTR85_005124 [Meristemomyces frigidus]